jgi:hypothetical protein
MKKFLQFVAAVKTIAAFAFTAQSMLVTVVSMLWGDTVIPIGYIWQMIFLSLIFACLHIHAFSEHESQKLNGAGRLAVLGVPMLLALLAFAYFFNWFPAGNLVNWLIFIGIYAAVFFIAIFAFRIAFRVSGMKYNEMLRLYKANGGKNL